MALSLLALTVVAAEPADVPKVRALAVTHLGFAATDREKLAEAALTMLESCGSSCPSTERDFENIFRQCHLHVSFATPREVTIKGTEKVKVDDLIISFPTNSGGIWLRTGTEYWHFTKFDYKPCVAIHELLKAGKPK